MNPPLASHRLIDLSPPFFDGAPAFPGDFIASVQPRGVIARGRYNTSVVSFGSHQGTHLDAMFHLFDDGRTRDRMPFHWFYGPARCIALPKQPNAPIAVAAFEPHAGIPAAGARIKLNSGWHHRYGTPEFFTDFPSFTLEAARFSAARRIRRLGLDLSTPGKQWRERPHIPLARDVATVLVEGLATLDAPPDTFTFARGPLNIRRRDGAPIRAVAICGA